MSEIFKFEHIREYPTINYGQAIPFIESYANISPPIGFNLPVNEDTKAVFPNCCKLHKQIFESLCKWIKRFPNCCEHHKPLAKYEGFSKEDFKTLPIKVAKQIAYTQRFISDNINNENWYEDIADYIEYNVKSFGRFYFVFRYGIGAEHYLRWLRFWVEHLFKTTSDDKFNELIKLIDTWFNDSNWMESFYTRKKEIIDLTPNINNEINLKEIVDFKLDSFRISGTNKFLKSRRYSLSMTDYGTKARYREIIRETFNEMNLFELHKEGKISDIQKTISDFQSASFVILAQIKYADIKTDLLPLIHYTTGINEFSKAIGFDNCGGQKTLPPPRESEQESEDNNSFNSMDLEDVKQHFKKLTELKSKKNNKPHLTTKQLDDFINIAFIQNPKNKTKIQMNFQEGEIGTIRRIFYDFYNKCKREYESSIRVKKKYVLLLTDNFSGFNYRSIHANFNK